MAKKNKDKPKYIKTIWWIFGGIWIFIFLFFTFLSMGWLGFMPSFEELENPRSLQASEVLADDGEVLGFIGVETAATSPTTRYRPTSSTPS